MEENMEEESAQEQTIEYEPAQEQTPRFQKKINVPTQYRESSKILRQILEEKKSLKELVYNNKHINKNKTLALINKILTNEKILDTILEKTEILKEPINPYLCKILVAEIVFFSKDELNGYSKPVQCVLSYKDKLMKVLEEEFGNNFNTSKQDQYKVPRYIRINTIVTKKSEMLEALAQEAWKLIDTSFEKYEDFLEAVRNLEEDAFLMDFHVKNLLVFPHSSRSYFANHSLIHEGKLIQVDKASCLPAILLDPPKKSCVLDMCSAPGNKTTLLATLMKNKGKIYAVEKSPERYQTLWKMVDNAQTSIVQAMNRDVLELTAEDCPNVQYILLDPSCSGSGMLTRSENEEKDFGRLHKLAGLQKKLLIHAMTTFPDVQKIVYSTCSVYPEENEEVLLGALRKVGNFKLANTSGLLKTEWHNLGSMEYPGITENVIYAKTKDDLTNGFFVAVLERCEEDESNEFYLQKQDHLKGQVYKRKAEENAEEPEKVDEVEEEEVPKKKLKKKWKNKGYNQ